MAHFFSANEIETSVNKHNSPLHIICNLERRIMVLSGSDQVLCNHQVIFNQAEQVVLHSAQLQIAHYALQQVPFDHSSSHVQKKKRSHCKYFKFAYAC